MVAVGITVVVADTTVVTGQDTGMVIMMDITTDMLTIVIILVQVMEIVVPGD
jgi:hypothetical protein